MNELQRQCQITITELDQIIKQAEMSMQEAPEGYLRISYCKNTPQYYWRKSSRESVGTYIRKSDRDIAKKLAQRDYATIILKWAIDRKSELEKCKQVNDYNKINELYKELPIGKQRLVEPYILEREEYVESWMKEQAKKIKMYSKKEKYVIDEESAIWTEQGEAVRSKSEKIIADKLLKLDIPYAYEVPIYLKGYGMVYPDFMVLNKETRNELYWEHFGLMDHSDYCEKAIKKIELYGKNGIFPGKNLILTYETATHPLNMKAVEDLIYEHLI